MTLTNDVFIQGDGGRIIACLVKQHNGTANLTITELSKIERVIIAAEEHTDEVRNITVAGSGAISGNNVVLTFYSSGATATSGPSYSGKYLHIYAAGK